MYDNTCTYLVTVFHGAQHTLPKLIYSHNTDVQEVNIISQEHREVLGHRRIVGCVQVTDWGPDLNSINEALAGEPCREV